MFASCLLAIGALGVVTQALPHDKARVEGVFRRQGCGNLQGPDVMFILDEARVDSWLPVNNTVFQVSQKAGTGGGTSPDGPGASPDGGVLSTSPN